MSEFDRFAVTYKDVLDRDISFTGEASGYFAEYKAKFLVQAAVPPGFAGKVLDYGCGVGLLAEAVGKHLPACTLHGFDVSAESLARIASDLRARGRFTADEAELDRDYDAILVANVLHHISPERRQATIRNLQARLSPTGRIVLFEHNPLNPVTQWVVRHSPLDKEATLLLRGEALAYLRGAGLRIERRAYIVFFPHLLARLRAIEPWLAWCPLGGQYALIAVQAPKDEVGRGRS